VTGVESRGGEHWTMIFRVQGPLGLGTAVQARLSINGASPASRIGVTPPAARRSSIPGSSVRALSGARGAIEAAKSNSNTLTTINLVFTLENTMINN
jgi:hypothetical protein